MFPHPERQKIALAPVILSCLYADGAEKPFPKFRIRIILPVRNAQTGKFFRIQPGEIKIFVLWMDNRCPPVIIDDHPMFRGKTVGEIWGGQCEYVGSGGNMADQNIAGKAGNRMNSR